MCLQEGKCISVSPGQVRCSSWALGWLDARHESWASWGLGRSPGLAGGSLWALGWLGDQCEPWASWELLFPFPFRPSWWRQSFHFCLSFFYGPRTLKEHQEDHEEMSSSALTSWARRLCKYSELRTLISAGAIPLSIIGALEKETNGSQHADNNCFGKDQEPLLQQMQGLVQTHAQGLLSIFLCFSNWNHQRPKTVALRERNN